MMAPQHLLLMILSTVIFLDSMSRAEDATQQLIMRLDLRRPASDRIAAAKALGESTNESALQAVKALADACSDQDAQMREAAVVALGTLLNRHKQPCHLALVKGMFDASETVRNNAEASVLLLVNRMPPEAIGLLLNHADHRNPQVRAGVITTLAYAAGEDTIVRAVLRQATHDRSLMVRNNATAGLWQATKDLSTIVPHWLMLVESGSLAETRHEDAELRSIVSIGAASQFQAVGAERPRELISTLLMLLADESRIIRGTAARSLGALAVESERSRQILKEKAARNRVALLLDDPDAAVRNHAAAALERLPE